MAEDVKPDVIKRTQETLGKYIKKPPLTEKLLKKPPFRFLHNIVTSVIRETGFLQGLLTEEELNPENIKDRESKVAFLQKVIDAVKNITGTNLTVRPTKIVAGHEATKTNELLQAIGSALDNKLSSEDYVAQNQTQKKDKSSKVKASSSRDEVNKSKSSTSSKTSIQSRGPSQDRNRTKDSTKKKTPAESKRSKPSTSKSEEEQGVAASSSSAASVVPPEQPTKPKASTPKPVSPPPEKAEEKQNSVSSQPEKHETDVTQSEKLKNDNSAPVKRRPDSAHRERLKSGSLVKHESQHEPSTSGMEPQPKVEQEEASSSRELDTGKVQEDVVSILVKEPEVVRPRTAHENRRKSARLKSAKETKSDDKPADATVISSEAFPSIPGGEDLIVLGGNRDPVVPVPRPKSVRPRSARPPSRAKSRLEVVTTGEAFEGEGKVKVITENESLLEQDEDENFIVFEARPVVLEDIPSAPPKSQTVQPGDDSQHGHLVAQILETQKELEDDAQRSLPYDSQNKKVDIEWDDAGRQREREIVSKEVERLRNSIQTLTRAANPLGKLMDFLQEDVDTMHEELKTWKNLNSNLRQQLLDEERKTEQSIQPLKALLEELNDKINYKLDEICSIKGKIMENEDNIRTNMTSSTKIKLPSDIPELMEEAKEHGLKLDV